ncbi:RMA1 (YKL132C) and FOL3 (YMR113W) [Zygosaccharomyces parabailii]|uniref:Dihydrofolate synthetase n=1 Tax=Zygosaccharomyces bailii (strain CLIB 213 / ATCC 58445 / CBS 680 / BCRC 21525 / NBRC 1098 / NCYC 1416 / NRRL Y-2227) TaxID=1333698 RepID=A0A8J2X780_ZYGB2|nr:RMA1 (YKL132C) and FOL3 (YMR113W) [Zygosaccharomyces parabailii]CDF88990.1 ZYBA0S03-06590g1_1 [Zygosaccharomyces bailii CLIB 213]
MRINLGLERVAKLLAHLGDPQKKLKVLHVAGTNGKGSVCSYLSSILQQGFRVGQFSSPHLVHITDSITVNSKPIAWNVYRDIRRKLETYNSQYMLHCTEFELLTCTAFKYFYDVHCDWCVIEVGLGGRLDATNIFPGACKFSCGITKIGLDHEAFLGTTLTQIGREKAGILVEGVQSAVVDGTNEECVLNVIEEQCERVGCELTITETNPSVIHTRSWSQICPKSPLNGAYQVENLKVALGMLDDLQQQKLINFTEESIQKGLQQVTWPGRLHKLIFHSPDGRSLPLLLDGAHNGSAALELAKFLRAEYGQQPLTFVIAVTQGKKLNPLLTPLIRTQDRVIVTQFGSVEGMPWIHAMKVEELGEYIATLCEDVRTAQCFKDALSTLAKENRPVIVCGSLYLVGEVLRSQC